MYADFRRMEKERRKRDENAVKRLHRAIKRWGGKASKKAVKNLMEHWPEGYPLMDEDNPERLDLLGKFVALNSIPEQDWEVRYRPRTAGHPLVLLHRWWGYPQLEYFQGLDDIYGRQETYYLIAVKPIWRIVLKITEEEKWW